MGAGFARMSCFFPPFPLACSRFYILFSFFLLIWRKSLEAKTKTRVESSSSAVHTGSHHPSDFLHEAGRGRPSHDPGIV